MEVSKETKKKAEATVNQGKVNKILETENRIHFKVWGETELHSVIYEKKYQKWKCDCKYYTLKRKHCSHILSCQILVEKSTT